MGLMLLVVLAPLLFYIIIHKKHGEKAGVYSAIFSALVLCVFYYVKLGELDYSMLVEVFFIILMGLVSLKFNNPKYFKFQPVVVGFSFGSFLLWFQVFDKPYLSYMLPRMAKLTPELQNILPIMEAKVDEISWMLIIVSFVHVGLVSFAALKLKDTGWFLMRLSIYPLMLIGLLKVFKG